MKLQEYDNNKKDKEEKVEEEVLEPTNDSKESDKPEQTLVYVESNKKNYDVEELFRMAKIVDSNFSIDAEKIIKDFISDKVKIDDTTYYNNLNKIKQYIEKIGIYNIMVSEDNYIKKIIEDLRKIDNIIVDKYVNNNKTIDINDFVNYLNSELDKNDPTIYVFVGQKYVNYDNLDNRIKTIYNDNIYKGLRIVYKNKMYDFSLS